MIVPCGSELVETGSAPPMHASSSCCRTPRLATSHKHSKPTATQPSTAQSAKLCLIQARKPLRYCHMSIEGTHLPVCLLLGRRPRCHLARPRIQAANPQGRPPARTSRQHSVVGGCAAPLRACAGSRLRRSQLGAPARAVLRPSGKAPRCCQGASFQKLYSEAAR